MGGGGKDEWKHRSIEKKVKAALRMRLNFSFVGLVTYVGVICLNIAIKTSRRGAIGS